MRLQGDFKPNYLIRSNVLHLHFYLPEVDYRSKKAMEPQQASLMSKMDGTRLLSSPSHFEPVYLLHASKNDDEECCF